MFTLWLLVTEHKYHPNKYLKQVAKLGALKYPLDYGKINTIKQKLK